MEKLRHRRSKNATHTESRSTCSQHSFRAPPSTPLDKHQNRQCAKLSSDSSSSSSTTGADYKIFYSFGWRSSKKASGTPIKKLLSEEMTRETETKRRSPNVIARLMGLDGFPVQQSFYRYQQKCLSESQLQKKSLEKSRKSITLYDQKSSRSSSKDQQQFKDVFEVSEMPTMGSCRYSPQLIADYKLTDSEMSSIEQKSVYIKYLSADTSFRKSTDLDDAVQVPDSNKHLLQRYVEQPNSLFRKHLNDLQVSTSHSHCYLKESVMALDGYTYENIGTGRKSDRSKLQENYQKTHQQCADGLQKKNVRGLAVSRSKSSNFQPLAREHAASIPTRIVVLKPNLGKVKNAIKTVSSPCTSQDILSDYQHTNFSVVRPQKADQEKKNSLDLHISTRCSKEPRDIAREITRQMKNNVNGSSVIFSPSTFAGYVGDESSCDFSGNESVDEPEVCTTNLRIRPTSRESSMNREARKRLSERWKMAHKSKEDQILSRGSTLAEMLAVPDKEVKTPKSDCIRGENSCDKFAKSDGSSSYVEPLGISSRDGWKDGCFQQFSRSKSLPASSTILASPTINSCNELLHNEWYMITKDASKGGRIKTRDLDRKDSLRRHPKYGYKKSHSRLPTHSVAYDSSPDKCRSQQKVLNISKESGQPNEGLVSDGVDISLRDTNSAPEISADPECENSSVPFEHKKKLSQETSLCVTVQGRLEHDEQSNLVPQELLVESSNECSMPFQPTVPGLESPSSCKDVDQPSPVSVLEPSFTDDMSSCSECFENLSADLEGLRMQLQLLKSETDAYAEGSLLASCYEDAEASAGNSDGSGSCRVEDTWESTYIVDILAYVGFADNTHCGKSIIEWHSPNDLINPSLFDELEKKYSDVTTCPRSERRLLFDRMNAELRDIHAQFIEPRPWLSSATKICPKFTKKRGESNVPLLLANLEKRENGDTMGKVLSRGAEWLDLWNDMDVIGREVETLLIDELIAEAVVRDFAQDLNNS